MTAVIPSPLGAGGVVFADNTVLPPAVRLGVTPEKTAVTRTKIWVLLGNPVKVVDVVPIALISGCGFVDAKFAARLHSTR